MMSKVALARLGMNSEANPRDTQGAAYHMTYAESHQAKECHLWPVVDNGKDYYVEKNGVKFAGTHLIIDLWGASNLDQLELTENALRESAEVAGATLLHCHLHHFSPNGGISGVLVLAESHISIHTWPERNFAALDIFMCGECDPYKSIPILKRAFSPERVVVNEQKRGILA
ncbi:S-adenosylmethionine decarboxylase proenzyme [Rhodospirillaceae bacterium LM-1]|nr:S-adenosylmethionine decarboxylase proenzyme [Rhodospirillaceae bacterium LM-1]